MIFGNRSTFALEVLGGPDLTEVEARSVEALSLRDIRVWCAGENVLQGTDDVGRFESLQVPLVDIAIWFAQHWQTRQYDVRVPVQLGKSLGYKITYSEWWELSQALDLTPRVKDEIYQWAAARSLEFAATDYALPNVFFQRVDDWMQVSWSAAASAGALNPVQYEHECGSILLNMGEWTSTLHKFLDYFVSRCARLKSDHRVKAIQALRQRSPIDAAREALRLWAPQVQKPEALVPDQLLTALGSSGTGGYIASFLRSADGMVPEKCVGELLALHRSLTPSFNFTIAQELQKDLPVGIDPRAPWESGLRLARSVRGRLSARKVDIWAEKIDIASILSMLGVEVRELELGHSRVDGAVLLDAEGRALAVLNPKGRLSRSEVGKRSTLAHELCHLLFDTHEARFVGQTDMRSDSSSLVEKRANAFAAEFLLPRLKVVAASRDGTISRDALRSLARSAGVGIELAEHQARNQGLKFE